jgi:hypothetical protein
VIIDTKKEFWTTKQAVETCVHVMQTPVRKLEDTDTFDPVTGIPTCEEPIYTRSVIYLEPVMFFGHEVWLGVCPVCGKQFAGVRE